MKIMRIKVIDAVVIVLLALSMLYRINSVKVEWYMQFIFFAPIVVMGLIKYLNNRKRLSSSVAKSMFKSAMLPHVVAFIYTVALLIFGLAQSKYFSRCVSNTMQMLFVGLFILSMLVLYEKESVFIMIKAMVVSYLITLYMALYGIGITGILAYITNPLTSRYTSWFEMHDLCLSTGLIVIFLLFCNLGDHSKWKTMAIVLIIMFMGYKRIGFLACAVACVFGFWVRKRASAAQLAKLWFVAVATLMFCFAYTYICTTDVYSELATRFGIDTASRVRIYANFRRCYDVSFTYLGQGVGFVTKSLTILQQSRSFGVGGITALHNDLLLQYIELGFIGSILWFVYYIFRLPKKLKNRFGYKIERLYYILLVCAFITYCSDNTMHYFIFQSTFFLILGSEILSSIQSKEGIVQTNNNAGTKC